MQLNGVFFVWDIGVLPRGWAYREEGVVSLSLGGPIENCSENEKHRYLRMGAATDFSGWPGEGSPPDGWRRASASEIGLLMSDSEIQGFIDECFC